MGSYDEICHFCDTTMVFSLGNMGKGGLIE